MVREQVMQALLDKISANGDYKTVGRRLQHWSKVVEQPALFVVEAHEDYPVASPLRPRLITMMAEVWIYSNASQNPDVPPAQELNRLLDGVEAAIAPEQAFRVPQTLGLAFVNSVRIEGRVEKDPGHLGGQAIAIVPVAIQVVEGK